jgi:hypothetical protein
LPDLLVFESKIDKWHVVHERLQVYEDNQPPLRNPPAQPRNIHYIFDIKVDRRPTNENFRDMQLGQSKQQILFARDLKTSQEWPVILNLACYLVKLVGLAPPF